MKALERIKLLDQITTELEARADPDMKDEAEMMRFLLKAFYVMREMAVDYASDSNRGPAVVDSQFEIAMKSAQE